MSGGTGIGSGTLRERVVLERVSDLAASGGGISRQFEPLATVWAGMRVLGGQSRLMGQAVGEPAPTLKALIRLTPYVASLAPHRRDTFVNWPRQQRRFRVTAAEELRGQGRFLSLDLVETGGAS